MRPGQNRRMRGRSRSKGPNPLTRTYESNGPDVKIRGTAQHVADKYAQLARDATVSGDPVSAENYLQHAEHYYRLIAAAQETYRQQFGTQGRGFDDDGEEGDEDGMSPNGFPYGPGQGGADEFGEGGGQPYEMRPAAGERQPQGGGRFDRNDRGYDRQGGERQDRQGGDRQGGDRNQRFDRNGERFDRNGGGGGFDRNGGERQDRQGGERQGGERQDRPTGERQGGDRQERQGGDRQGGDRGQRFDRNGGGGQAPNGERFERPPQDRPEGQGRERFPRNEGRDGGRREFGRDRPSLPRPEGGGGGRFPGQGGDEREEPIAAGLPAFLTTPVRSSITLSEDEGGGPAEAAAPFAGESQGGDPVLNGSPEARPRRARRPRRTEASEDLDFGGAEAEKQPE